MLSMACKLPIMSVKYILRASITAESTYCDKNQDKNNLWRDLFVHVLIQNKLWSKSNSKIIIFWKNTKCKREGITAWVSDRGPDSSSRLKKNWHLEMFLISCPCWKLYSRSYCQRGCTALGHFLMHYLRSQERFILKIPK